jgi:hypothetical protein
MEVIMKLEIPVNQKTYKQIRERMNHFYTNEGRNHVFFISPVQDDVLFVLAHGGYDEETNIGFVQINNEYYTPEEVLKNLLKKGKIQNTNVKEVVLICCHPGYMKEYEQDNIRISSISDTLEEIQSRGIEYIDDNDEIGYALEIFC